MKVTIGSREFFAPIQGQHNKEVKTNDGTLLIQFNNKLMATETEDNDDRKIGSSNRFRASVMNRASSVDRLALSAFAPAEFGVPQEYVPMKLTAKFEALLSVEKIFTKNNSARLFHNISPNCSIATASTAKKEGYSLVAVSTSCFGGSSLIAIIAEEEKSALMIHGGLESHYKNWNFYQVQDLSLFIGDLFYQYSNDFNGLYSLDSYEIQIREANNADNLDNDRAAEQSFSNN